MIMAKSKALSALYYLYTNLHLVYLFPMDPEPQKPSSILHTTNQTPLTQNIIYNPENQNTHLQLTDMPRRETQPIIEQIKDKPNEQVPAFKHQPKQSAQQPTAADSLAINSEHQRPNQTNEIDEIGGVSEQQGCNPLAQAQDQARVGTAFEYDGFFEKHKQATATFYEHYDEEKQKWFAERRVRMVYGYDKVQKWMQNHSKVRVVKDYHDYSRVDYEVKLSKFQITVKVCIYNCESGLNSAHAFDNGGFGEVYSMYQNGKYICLKTIKYNDKWSRLYKNASFLDFVREIGICRFFGILGVGPELIGIDTQKGCVDMLAFNDCVCFRMEQCCNIFEQSVDLENCSHDQQLLLKQARISQIVEEFERDVGNKIALLHSMKIVHRDIKPKNIVFRQRQNKTEYFLIDFGLTHAIGQDKYTKSYVKVLGGTLEYMKEDFFSLMTLLQKFNRPNLSKNQREEAFRIRKENRINLYENDLNALKSTIQDVKEILKQKVREKKTNHTILLDLPKLEPKTSIQSLGKQINYLKLVKKFDNLLYWKWKQKISLLEQSEQGEETQRMHEYFSMQNIVPKLRKERLKDVSILQVDQGKNRLQEQRLLLEDSTFLFFIYEYSSYLKDMSSEKENKFKNLEEHRTPEQQLRISQFIVQSSQLGAGEDSADVWLTLQQGIINPVIERLIAYYLTQNNQFKADYYKIMRSYLTPAIRNRSSTITEIENFANKYKDAKQYGEIVEVCDAIASSRFHVNEILKLVEIALKVREYNQRSNQEGTSIMLIQAGLNILLSKVAYTHSNPIGLFIDKACTQAEKILKQLYPQYYQHSRLMTKIRFVRALDLANQNRLEEARQQSHKVEQNVVNHFGQESDFHVSTLFNLSYIYDKLGDHRKSLDYMEKAITGMRRIADFQDYLYQGRKMLQMNSNLPPEHRFPELEQILPQLRTKMQILQNQPMTWRQDLIKLLRKYGTAFIRFQEGDILTPVKINCFMMLDHVIDCVKYYPAEIHIQRHNFMLQVMGKHQIPAKCSQSDEQCKDLQEGYCLFCHDCLYYYQKRVNNPDFRQKLQVYQQILLNHQTFFDSYQKKYENIVLCQGGIKCKQFAQGKCRKVHPRVCPAYPDCNQQFDDLCSAFLHPDEFQIQWAQAQLHKSRQQIFQMIKAETSG